MLKILFSMSLSLYNINININSYKSIKRDSVFYTRIPGYHRDTYKKYIELFGCDLSSIIRFVVFIEDWYPGHYLEVEHKPIVEWKCGDYVWWRGDVEHMAANIGKEFRFTLQITGHYGL